MSANPITSGLSSGLSELDLTIREVLLDDPAIIRAFEKAADLSQYSQEDLVGTEEWIVLADTATDITQLAAEVGFEVVGETGVLPGSYIIDAGDDTGALIAALTGNEAVDYFYPSISLGALSRALPNDPLLKDQWNLINFGQQVGGPGFQFIRGVPGEDINVQGAWEDGVTGLGVQIGIVDTSIFTDHPDLFDNIREDLALGSGGASIGSAHGTAVAGIAAGVGNNGIGITGVAYEADIVPIRLLQDGPIATGITDAQIAQALLHQFQEIDVYNHSWGLVGETSRTILDFGPFSLTALRNSVFFGRGGLGAIHVWAAGNDGEAGTSSQYDGFVNSRYTIGVTIVDHDGEPENVDGTTTGYGEGGANILIAASSASSSLEIIRDTQLGSGITTTDLPGNEGFNVGPDGIGLELDNDFLFDDSIEGDLLDFTSRFSGTSAAAPLVSGTIALMLQVNPTLTYRDVQHILVRTARQSVPTDSAWITNVRQHQVDPLDPVTAPGSAWLDPAAQINFIDRLPSQFTNGAGFTVNQGTGSYGDGGLGHGVLDASAAVEMARNWETVGPQQSELTWTTDTTLSGKIWDREISSEDSGEILIPGGLTGDGDSEKTFGDYYNEFFEDDPFVDDMGMPDPDAPVNDRELGAPGIPIFGMPSMAVEWVEVELNLGADAQDLDFLRITLVSPDGTNSELNVFGQNVTNAVDHFDGIGGVGPSGGNLGTTNLILTTNRHWGERTEAKARVDDTGAPLLDFLGNPIIDGWSLVFENYSDSEIDIQNYNVTFHGVSTAGTSRVQGALGIDLNGDTFFSDTTLTANNFTRFVTVPDPFGGPIDVRINNPDQEPFAGGVVVYADINSDGVRDSTEPFFETGADGNYYFDLPPATYDIRIDETALPDALDNAANITLAQSGPITTVIVGGIGERITPEQLAGDPTVVALNAVLTPNAPVIANTFSFSGVVFADLDADGVQGGNDGVVGGAELFLDVNQNGVFDPLVDPETVSAADGTFTLTTNPILPPLTGFYSVFVVDGTTGAFSIATSPTDAEQAAFATLGDAITGIDFGFSPVIVDDPDDPDPGGDPDPPVDPATPGAIAGVVFVDANGSGAREGEAGAANVTVYIDADNDGVFDVGELSRVTGANGAYVFDPLPSSTYIVRIETPAGFEQTAPNSIRHTVSLQPGQGAIGRDFGVRSLAVNDWGDLPAAYNLTLDEDNGARHKISPIFFLGTIDGEIDGAESADATGDDGTTFDDEDGIAIDELTDLTTSLRIVATANSTGGAYLRAWMDFNGDFDFDDPGEVVTFAPAVGGDVAVEPDGTVIRKLLTGGANELFVNVPAALLASNVSGTVFARFRYGEFEIDSPSGLAAIGEVEDYAIPIVVVNPGGAGITEDPDFDGDGDVDGADFLAWQRGFGSVGASATDGDANDDGIVNSIDLSAWTANYGSTTGGALAALSGDGGGFGDYGASYEDTLVAPLEPLPGSPVLAVSPISSPNEDSSSGADASLLAGLTLDTLTVDAETSLPADQLGYAATDLLFNDLAPLAFSSGYDFEDLVTELSDAEDDANAEELEFAVEDEVFEMLGS